MTTQPDAGSQDVIAPAPGAAGSSEALAPPLPTAGLPFPPAPEVSGTANSQPVTESVDLSWLDAIELPGTVPEKPANWDEIKQRLRSGRGASAKSASDAVLNLVNPFDPFTITALNQFAPPNGGSCYAFVSSDNPVTPGLETFNAQQLPGGASELHIWGSVTDSSLREMILAEIGLVTEPTYSYAMDPNGDGSNLDAVPSWMFNQNVAMVNGVTGGQYFGAPLDFNGDAGRGFARAYNSRGFDFDLRLEPNTGFGNTGGLCWLRLRPRSNPRQPWASYAGMIANPAQGFPYGIDNWAWNDPEDFSSALLVAQIYSFDPTGLPGSITFRWVRATTGPLIPPCVDCRSISDARFLLASPGLDGLQGTPDDTALTGFASTNAVMDIEPVLVLGDRFYVYFDRDPAQANDISLYPNVPVAGLVQYTTVGLIADAALAAYFDLPDAVPGYPGMVYSAAHPFVLLLRNGAYNRIQNDVRSLSWANYQLGTNPGMIAISPVRPTSTSDVDRVILAQGVQYTPFYYNLPYTQAGSLAPQGAAETIYPNAHLSGWIAVGYGNLSEGGTGLGSYYNQAALTNTLQADAYCRFETRTNWSPNPQYGLADLDLLQWIALPNLDPRAVPWNTFVLARGTNFFLQTTDISVSPFVNVAAGQLLDAGLGPVMDVPFNAVGGGGPYTGSFNVLPVRVFDDPTAQDPDQTVSRAGGSFPAQWDVTVNFLLQYGVGPYTVELDSDYDGAWDSLPTGYVYQIDGDTSAAGIQQFTVSGTTYSRDVRIPSSHPAGGFNFAIRVTDVNGDQYTYVWPGTVWLIGPPVIDCRTLPGARYNLRRPNGNIIVGNLDTDVVYDATALIAGGNSFYIDFFIDGAQSPTDRALYPARPAGGVFTYGPQGVNIGPALQPYFDTADNGYTLHLRPGAYNRITNDVDSLSWANYALYEDATGTAIMAPRPTNTSAADRVVLRANINYRPRFSTLTYPLVGSNLRTETIYPVEWVTGYIITGFGSLSEGGTVLGSYFNQAGLVNTLQSDAFCRFESDARAMGATNYGFIDVATGGAIVPVVLNPAARPYDALALARGTVFYARDAALNVSGNVTVGAGQVLNGVTALNLPLGLGSLNLNVLPVRVFDNPAASDPSANVTQVGSDWDVVVNFMLQYGAPNYTVQLDGDWGGAWNDGTAGRIYTVPGSPYGATGLLSSTVHIPSASQPAGTYTFAIRVTDGLGAQYIYVWPTPVNLP